MRIALAILAACLAAVVPVCPAATADEGERAQVQAVLDAGTLALSDGRQVRLVQVRPPEPHRSHVQLADAAQGALTALVLDRAVVLRFPGPQYDRYGRLLARVELADGTWVQARLVEQGWARVASDEDHLDGLEALLILEDSARGASRGLWADWRYRVMDPVAAAKAPEGFHLIEGTVTDVATVGAWTYLNFGEDWRTDFTVSIHRRDRRRMVAGLGDLDALAGRQVRARGWMRHFNGPLVEATYPQQIQVLD